MFTIRKDVKIHFIGIGGIGMSGIAEVLVSMGYQVSGSDASESPRVEKLRSLGAEIYIGHNTENLKNVTVLVYSSAINDKNPEMVQAKIDDIPIMRRAEMLAELMRLKYGMAIGGTHGKTTTTSFLATILQESQFDPTYIIGGIVKNLDGHAKVGKGKWLVAEADESDGSFLLLDPIMSVVTNIDNDHLDHYGNEENLFEAFNEFCNKVPFYGMTALNAHDDRLMKIKVNMKKPSVTFGIGKELDELADFEARELTYSPFGSHFDLYHAGEKKVKIDINLPGRHNVLNSLGAIALAYNMGVAFDLIAESIKKFDGVGRRFQLIPNNINIEVIDDYGHHPTEIHTTIKTVKDTRPDSKVVVIFEPHRYSRTRDCWNDFLHCFNTADELYLAPIYPASEKEIPGISSARLIEDINKLHPNFAKVMGSINELGSVIESFKGQNVSVVTLGAGSIGRTVRTWAEKK